MLCLAQRKASRRVRAGSFNPVNSNSPGLAELRGQLTNKNLAIARFLARAVAAIIEGQMAAAVDRYFAQLEGGAPPSYAGNWVMTE
jgi:hypothetical protein